ncbi:hypothetical protein ACVWW1_001250 [Bradyrhizobium sp. JR3.5]
MVSEQAKRFQLTSMKINFQDGQEKRQHDRDENERW